MCASDVQFSLYDIRVFPPMLMKTGGLNEIGTRPGVSLVDVLILVFIYYQSKQKKPH